ncbi:unnamed protein product [Fusarium venenatum]|uniref:RelA/SpoT domain-containing protein n=1 Tax=Fusarium venenatum TaxID=56646 RepID=A0A2L2TQB1_9HYPO|nr:uncharacterized protein FVRRES_08168 [Fusarium venenatum]CEI68091.1 unnamed protein product [Fusarium venenatum]
MGSSQPEGGGQQTTHCRLIEERYLAFRDVEPGGSPVEAFLNLWPRLEPHYGTMVEQLKSALQEALNVRCTISARVKSLSSITKSIERRQSHRGERYKEVDEIFDDLHDLAGFRIVVDYPSGIQIVKAFIAQNFQLKSTNVFRVDREINDSWKPTFGSFQSENHHVFLHSDAKYPLSPFCNILFEIQILSLAGSLYNRLAHPLLYKKSSGQLPVKDQKMIDVTHGLSLCYGICLSCMEDRLEGKRTEEIPSPVQEVAQLDGNQNADMESFVKATPYSMPASDQRIPNEKCVEFVKDLPMHSMSSGQLNSRLSLLLNGSTQTSTTNVNSGSGHIMQNYGSGTNNAYSAGGDITIAKEDIEDEIRNAFWVTDPQSHKEDIEERKTMSVCGIIDYISLLSVRESKDANINLSYFFCDASDSNLNNATSVLRGIVYSIIFQNSMALSYVRKHFKEISKPLADPRLAWPVLQRTLIGILNANKYQKTYLIIDGLDECRDDRDKLLEFIVKHSSLLQVKWLVSSRKWPVIKEVLATCPALLELCLEDNETNVSAAVSFYITQQVERLSTIKRYDMKKKEAVELHLRSKANSTFLWVSLVCRMLKQIPAWQTMKRLDTFPAGLDALYGRMLEQLQTSSEEEGDLGFDELYAQLISIALSVFRPLSIDELYSLVDDDDITANEFEDIIALCGSFLTVQHRVVYFIHDSAKDFLLNDASGFEFCPRQQHAMLFSQSLSNLTRSLHRDMLQLETNHPLPLQKALGSFSYQCIYWIHHLTECEIATLNKQLVDGSQVDNFLRNMFLFWVEGLSHLTSIGLGISSILKLEQMLHDNSSNFKRLVQDQSRYIRYISVWIEQRPLQVYSLLRFSPINCITRKLYEPQAPDWFSLKQGVDEDWSLCILTMEGHNALVQSIDFSEDGCLLDSGAFDNKVKIWDVLTGTCLHTLQGHDDRVLKVAFSRKDYQLASGSSDETIKIWDAKNGALIRTLADHNSPVDALAYGRKGGVLASGSYDGIIKLFDTLSGVCTRTIVINHNPKILSIDLTHDDQILSCRTSYSLLIWDLKAQTDPYRIQLQDSHYGKLVSSQTGELFLIDGNQIEILNPATKMRMQTIKYPAPDTFVYPSYARSAILSKQGTLLGVTGDSTVKFFDPSTQEWTRQIEEQSQDCSVSPTSDILALASDSTIKLWDLSLLSLWKHSSQESDCPSVFSNDGSLIATRSRTENGLVIWRSCTGESIFTFRGDCIPTFSPDSQMLLLRDNDHRIYIKHMSQESVYECIDAVSRPHGVILEISISYDKRWLAVSFQDRFVCIWDVAAKQFGSTVANLKINSEDEDAKETADDGTAYDPNIALSFSHDSANLAVYDGKYIMLYESSTWRCKSTIYNYDRNSNLWDHCVVFSSDDKFLATTGLDFIRTETKLNIWNLETMVCMRITAPEEEFSTFGLDTSAVWRLETSSGIYEIIDHAIHPVRPKYEISEDLHWICKGTERLLWLPPEFRPEAKFNVEIKFCRDCLKFKVAIVTSAKRIVFLTLP